MLRHRGRERLLLLPPIALLAVLEMSLSLEGKQSFGATFAAVGLFGCTFLAGNIALSVRRSNGDELLLPSVALLTSVGLAFNLRLHPSTYHQQFAWIILAVIVAVGFGASGFDVWWLSRFKYSFASFGFLLLAATALFGREINGARLWLAVGPIEFQTTELMKIVLAVFMAGYLEEKRELLTLGEHRWRGVRLPPLEYIGPLAVLWLASLLSLLWQRDLGGTLLLLGVALAMLYVGTERLSYVFGGLLLFLLNVVITYHFFGYVRSRVNVWLDPWAHARSQGYQIVQALYAVSSGGLFGSGIGRGYPGYIPEVYTDFIFAAIGEELGLLGSFALLTVFAILVMRAFRIAIRCSGTFERLLATGLGALLALQTLVIVAGNLEVIPLTGITLPFVSYGGSSMIINAVIVGLLLRLSASQVAPRGRPVGPLLT
ncbi:MAG: FtsW/RodA/SpoVE family cell cycle protein [Chloroflexi bacterium]|nr:FtsW/RodA/SpoVE family cell cycle protein [Chloroflexota bacterium]